MSDPHSPIITPPVEEKLHLGDDARGLANTLLFIAAAAGALALVVGFVWGGFGAGEHQGWFAGGFSYIMHSYLVGFMFCLAITLGAIFMVTVTYIFRAGWVVNVRRIFEAMGASVGTVGLFAIPIVLLALLGMNPLYSWSVWDTTIAHHDETAGAGHAEDAEGHGGDAAPQTDLAAPEADHASAADADQHAQLAADAGHAEPAHDTQTVTPNEDGSITVQKPLASPITHTAEQAAHAARNEEGNVYVSTFGEIAYTSHEDTKVYDELTAKKRGWLNPLFFAIRVPIYFLVWIGISRFFWKGSVRQDQTRDPRATYAMEKRSPPFVIAFGVTLTLAAFDFIMSLDPHWFSTIFGVYYFAGAFEAALCMGVITLNILQRNGYLKNSVRLEHYHDLGKLMFAFVFFWGYIAFSQYMLLWYANIPETTTWLSRRGMTTFNELISGWTAVALALLFGHLLIPFAGLLSRHVKRSLGGLTFWAVWILIFCWVDLWWLISPEMRIGTVTDSGLWRSALRFPVVEILATVCLLSFLLSRFINRLSQAALRPVGDARAVESTTYVMKY